ncbi:MAG: hypothetical protein HY690_08380 [Chloroflexi bacterium]|nr:hypothetical protein [Chloroflexota bacterium]
MDQRLARAKADEILARAYHDAAFLEQLIRDPRGVLLAAGVPAAEIDDEAIKQARAERGDVEGYTYTVSWLTCCCIRTSCCLQFS